MANELTVYKPSQFMALDGGSPEMREAMESIAEVEGGFNTSDLTRVKVPAGGATNWTIEGPVDENTPEITGVLCYVQKHGVLWASEEPVEGEQPVLRSFDLKTADQVGNIPPEMVDALEPHRLTDPEAEGIQLFDWANIPYNQWGTGKGGVGKRAKESRLLFILRPEDIYPLVINCPPGSLTDWRRFFLKLPQATRLPYWYSTVTLKLEKTRNKAGQTYAQIVPSLAGVLDKETGGRIYDQFTSRLGDVAKQVADELAAEDPAEDTDEPF